MDVARHLAHFDALYAESHDPWSYERSAMEAYKRATVLAALGSGPLGEGVELGCGPGVSTAAMAPRFASLLALDGSAEAVRIARGRLAPWRHVTVRHAWLPAPLPANAFDAVIATELLYYLPRPDLSTTLRAVRASLRPGGRFVSTNSLARFGDAELSNAELTGRQREVFGPPSRITVGAGWRLDLHTRR